ncbi:molybdopterin-synthase adenylyltransferase MoeB [Pedobacter polaris]|uniref:Molybdopterin-synthase adenylyltransferase n=1 Tax=Pedobacter polaris TaxID=2571273 RepID=A0A4U1CQH0_9SPHI|nr:HesA/MoeB/ThiF family protein [Pedobacter polaris]TKC09914.1 molybdopterin-synthase adenylyltransferase MoeB [Pedobacter polaris]
MASERYHRQLILKGFGEEAQLKLASAKVLVIGVGGLGCPALQYLAAAGIGHLGLVDDDTVALSNLHRQVLYTTTDIGKLKVEVAAERLVEMNPEIEIITYPTYIQRNNILNLIQDYHIVLDGTDNFETRYIINDACALLNIPLVFAAVDGYEGQLAIFNIKDDNGICTNYRDLFPIPPKKGEIPNCAENGVLGVLPGIIGSLAAAEVIKLITEIGKPLINRLLHYNILTLQQYELNMSSGSDYTLPHTVADFLKMEDNNSCEIDSYLEIDATQLKQIQQKPSTLIIDVREEFEVPLLNPDLYKKIPMSKLDEFLAQEVTAYHVIFICQHGIRSITAAENFHKKYGTSKKVYSLKGGIAKWRNHLTI